jgi:hypothetical protein
MATSGPSSVARATCRSALKAGAALLARDSAFPSGLVGRPSTVKTQLTILAILLDLPMALETRKECSEYESAARSSLTDWPLGETRAHLMNLSTRGLHQAPVKSPYDHAALGHPCAALASPCSMMSRNALTDTSAWRNSPRTNPRRRSCKTKPRRPEQPVNAKAIEALHKAT